MQNRLTVLLLVIGFAVLLSLLLVNFGVGYAFFAMFLLFSVFIVSVKPYYGLILLILVIPLEQFQKIPGLTFGEKTITTGNLLALVTLGVWIFILAIKKEIRINMTELIVPLAVFMLFEVLSMVQAQRIDLSIIRIVSLTSLILLYIMVRNLIHYNVLRSIMAVVIIAVTFVALYSISQFVFSGISGLNIEIPVEFEETDLKTFPETGTPRVVGTYSDPNDFSAFLVLNIPLLLMFQSHYKGFRRILLILATIVCLIAVALTLSRAGIIGLGVVLLASLIIGRGKAMARFIPIILISGLAVSTVGISTVIMNRFVNIVKPWELEKGKSIELRYKILTSGINMFVNNPILGVGAGNFRERVSEYGEVSGKIAPHNSYVEILSEIGIIGFCAWMFVVYKVFKTMAKNMKGLNDEYLLNINNAILIGMIGFCVIGFMLNVFYKSIFWYYMGIIMALSQIDKEVGHSTEQKETGRLTNQKKW